MIQREHTVQHRATSERMRKNTIQLLRLLASRTDAIARLEIYRLDAEHSGKPLRAKIFRQMRDRERDQADWLKHQIARSLGFGG